MSKQLYYRDADGAYKVAGGGGVGGFVQSAVWMLAAVLLIWVLGTLLWEHYRPTTAEQPAPTTRPTAYALPTAVVRSVAPPAGAPALNTEGTFSVPEAPAVPPPGPNTSGGTHWGNEPAVNSASIGPVPVKGGMPAVSSGSVEGLPSQQGALVPEGEAQGERGP